MHLANIRAARKEGNLQKELYYIQAMDKGLTESFESFKNSKNYEKWLNSSRNQKILREMEEDRRSA